jgi:hypothetical protein
VAAMIAGGELHFLLLAQFDRPLDHLIIQQHDFNRDPAAGGPPGFPVATPPGR